MKKGYIASSGSVEAGDMKDCISAKYMYCSAIANALKAIVSLHCYCGDVQLARTSVDHSVLILPSPHQFSSSTRNAGIIHTCLGLG